MIVCEVTILALSAAAIGTILAIAQEVWHNKQYVNPKKCGCFYCK